MMMAAPLVNPPITCSIQDTNHMDCSSPRLPSVVSAVCTNGQLDPFQVIWGGRLQLHIK